MAFGNGTKLYMKMENAKGAFQKCAEGHSLDDEAEFPDDLYDAKVLALSVSLHVLCNYANHHIVYSRS